MPVSPDEAFKHETPEEADCIKQAVREIDCYLLEHYQNYGRINVPFSPHKTYGRRVSERLRELYKIAGWQEIAICGSECIIGLDRDKTIYPER